jgi:tRNA A37 threonylcarbamoyltransferase TsaD
MFVHPLWLCTDQDAMSAWAANERIMQGITDDPSDQEVYAHFPYDELQELDHNALAKSLD